MLVVVVSHLEPRPLETALDVEALVGLAAVEDGLVAADLVGNKVEGLDQPKTQLLPLLILCDGDVFDVSDGAEAVDASCRLLSEQTLVTSPQLEGGVTRNYGLGCKRWSQLTTCAQP